MALSDYAQNLTRGAVKYRVAAERAMDQLAIETHADVNQITDAISDFVSMYGDDLSADNIDCLFRKIERLTDSGIPESAE